MDLQMPGMDGFTAARAIRDLASPNQHTPIVALSANVLPEHVEACAEAGMNDHVAKPISPAELIAAVAMWAGVERQGLSEPRAAHA
jgi:CheY-like chemotaxis protein